MAWFVRHLAYALFLWTRLFDDPRGFRSDKRGRRERGFRVERASKIAFCTLYWTDIAWRCSKNGRVGTIL